jgi:iron complex transport system ATP-binding protein
MSGLLNINQLSWCINNQYILQDISLNIRKGEVLGIIGPNGAGKTSLLRCLINQKNILKNKGISGNIHFKNKNIISYTPKEVAQSFALVMQKPDPIFSLSVQDVLKMGLLPHKSLFSLESDHDKEKIKNSLNKVGLSHMLHSDFSKLSGGEQQRVLIARALVQSPSILILDEPTNHLDVFYQHQLLYLIKQLNITVIMTVHDLNLASSYCQRLLLLDKGKLVSDGSPEEVLTEKRLSDVFGLSCQQDINPLTKARRVSFYLNEELSNSKTTTHE